MCSSIALLRNTTLSVPFSQSGTTLVRVHRTHYLSNAKLIANVISRAFTDRISIGFIIAKWCKQIKSRYSLPKLPWWKRRKGQPRYYFRNESIRYYPTRSNQLLKIQIDASDRSQQFVNSTMSSFSPTMALYSVFDYAFLTTQSRMGAIGIKVVVLMR